MRVLVTGASGFVGRALVPALSAAGHGVRAALRDPRAAIFSPDVDVASYDAEMDHEALLALVRACDAIVHLAGIAHVGPGIPEEAYDRINHRATVRLARAAQAAGVKRFVFVSSIRAQSGPSSDRVLTEDDPPRPTDAYGRSKLAAENALRASDLPCVILRPVLIYGPGVKGNFAALARLAALPIPLPLAGLTKPRSLLALENFIQALLFSLDAPTAPSRTFIVSDATPLSVAQILAALRRGMGRRAGLIGVPPSLMRTALGVLGRSVMLDRLNGQLVADSARLRSAGWKQTVETEAALEHFRAI